MLTLPALSQEDRELIVGLAYRVGVWMSHADDRDGEGDDDREARSLHKTLETLSASLKIPAFARDVALEAFQHKARWPVWEENAFDVIPDCERAMSLIKARGDDKEIRAYRTLLLHIASTVAGAYGEFGDMDAGRKQGLLSRAAGSLAAALKIRPRTEAFMNISSSEEAALERLRAILHS